MNSAVYPIFRSLSNRETCDKCAKTYYGFPVCVGTYISRIHFEFKNHCIFQNVVAMKRDQLLCNVALMGTAFAKLNTLESSVTDVLVIISRT